MIGVTKLNRLYNRLCAKRDFYTSQYVACAAGRYGSGEILERTVFEKTVPLEFEHLTLQAPQGYEAYLKSIYGDYMTLPPEEKQVSNHSSEEWWKD